MTIPTSVIAYLRQQAPHAYCDECIGQKLGARTQQVQPITATLGLTPGFPRKSGFCQEGPIQPAAGCRSCPRAQEKSSNKYTKGGITEQRLWYHGTASSGAGAKGKLAHRHKRRTVKALPVRGSSENAGIPPTRARCHDTKDA